MYFHISGMVIWHHEKHSETFFNPFLANTSLLRTLISGYIERKQGSKLVNTFRKQSSLSYSLFAEFEINSIFDTSGEAIAAKDSS